jgi:hypothetical protein
MNVETILEEIHCESETDLLFEDSILKTETEAYFFEWRGHCFGLVSCSYANAVV